MNTEPQPQRRSWPRRLLRWLVLGMICYTGVVLVLLALENKMVYFPTSAREHWLGRPSQFVQDVNLTLDDGTTVHGWWYPYEGSQGALLYFHGNAGNLSHRGDAIAQLHDRLQESVLIIDYPGYGKSTGSPSEAGCYAAADAAYQWLTQTQKIAPERIILYGKSLGGGVAVDLAQRWPHRALVLVKTFTSLPDAAQRLYPWLPVRWLMRNRFDSLSKIADCKQPVFVAHGTTDSIIAYDLGERLFAAAPGPKHFCRLERIDHNDALPALFYDELLKFLNQHGPKN